MRKSLLTRGKLLEQKTNFAENFGKQHTIYKYYKYTYIYLYLILEDTLLSGIVINTIEINMKVVLNIYKQQQIY